MRNCLTDEGRPLGIGLQERYIGMDVHKESISIAVRNTAGKTMMKSVIETKANLIRRQSTETENSLSVSDRVCSHAGNLL